MAELRVGAATDKGRVRPENEDNMLVSAGAFVVADGMGGHEAGEVASQIVVDRIRGRLDEIASLAQEVASGSSLPSPSSTSPSPSASPDTDDTTADVPITALPTATQFVSAISTANSDIFRAALVNPAQRGMGTTVTAIAVIADPYAGRGAPNVVVEDPSTSDAPGDTEAESPGDVTPIKPVVPSEALVLANVGDSRTYLLRHGRLRRVTIDHSYVQELVATGHITENEARTHPRRNIITRALGIEPDVRVDWWTLPLIRGDRFVLCSDGLVDEVADPDITAILTATADPQVAADLLVAAANDAGGRDNVTVIVVDVLDGDEPPDPTLEIDVVPTWADDAAGPTPSGTLSVDADPIDAIGVDPHGPLDRAGRAAAGGGKKRSGVKKFVVAFAAAAALVIGFVMFSVWASSGYFVAFNDDDEAIVFKGRPGGALWIDPTAQNEAGPGRDQLEPDRAELIDDEPRFDSKQEAVDFLRNSATTTTTTTTTSTTTTTTTIDPALDPTATTTPTAVGTGIDGAAPTGVTTTSGP